MRQVLIGAAAAMALLGAASLATAQAPADKDKGPATQGKGQAPDSKPDTGRSEQAQPPTPGAGPKAERRDERSGKDQPRATEQQPGKDRPKATEQQQPGKDRPKATEQQQPGKDRPKATEQQQPGKDRPKATEQQQPGKSDRVQVSEQQRSSIGERLRQGRVEKIRINVSVNIGSTLPRSVRLRALPVAIIELAPAYRGHSYVVLEDETILIVDARTYVIVDVIPAGTQRADRRGGAHLALSADQMRFIFTRVPKERRADVRVRLALGAEVPKSVELLAFPGIVTERIPEVQRYRYVVADDDVVVVDPTDNGVVLVISE